MKKTHKMLLVLLGVIVLAVAGFKAMQPKEPEYQGRKLSEWIADLGEAPPKNTEAEVAVRQMPNVVLPFVEARILQNEDPQSMSKGKRLLTGIQVTIAGRRFSQAYQWADDFQALRVLGTNSLSVLEKLMLNPESSREACELLAELDAVEILAEGTKANRVGGIRWNAILALRDVAKRKDEAANVLLPLIDDPRVAEIAIRTLSYSKRHPEKVVPLLYKRMESTDSNVVANAIYALGEYGTNSVMAVPALQKISASQDEFLKFAAEAALREIMPKTTP